MQVTALVSGKPWMREERHGRTGRGASIPLTHPRIAGTEQKPWTQRTPCTCLQQYICEVQRLLPISQRRCQRAILASTFRELPSGDASSFRGSNIELCRRHIGQCKADEYEGGAAACCHSDHVSQEKY